MEGGGGVGGLLTGILGGADTVRCEGRKAGWLLCVVCSVMCSVQCVV